MKSFWIISILTALCACNTNQQQPIPQTKALGLLEVTLDLSNEANPTGTANFVPFANNNSPQTRAISTNGNESSQIALRRRSVSFIDDNESSLFGTQTRYVRGTFDFANFSPRAFHNLNFMAANLPGNGLGTMFSSLKDGAEVVIPATDTLPTGELTYRGLKPSHGMRFEGSSVVVDPQAADMQVFTPAEASSVQTSLANIYPGVQVLEYGFTARSLPSSSTSRNIAITPTSANCSSTLTTPPNTFTNVVNSTSCLTGRVTFAFKFARKAVRSQNPFVFSFVFVVADETSIIATQSLEEQHVLTQTSLAQVLGLGLPIGETRKIRTLPGGGFIGYQNPSTTGVQSEMICHATTAAATSTPSLAAAYLSTNPGLYELIPTPNSNSSGTSSSLVARFCDNMSNATSTSFVMNGSLTGRHSSTNGTYFDAGDSMYYNPVKAFKPGEEVEVSLTGITRASDAVALNPVVYRFKTATVPEASPGFATATISPTGNSPFGVTTGDFNGDGNLDVANVNSTSNTISVKLGTGSGTFGPKSDYLTGLSPRKITSSDFNGDGIPDLATTNGTSNNVSVLLGTGSGSFGAKVDYPIGSSPLGITTGDFNGDGKPDLVTTNGNSNSISILLGTGSGSFGTKVDYTTGSGPWKSIAGDFNGDGKLDLATTNTISSTISVFLGTGSGTFGTKVDYALGANSYGITTGDFNGDGIPDLATANTGSNNINVFYGTGSGTFNTKTDYPLAFGSIPQDITTGDFNGDGISDLATANTGSNNINVFFGTSSGLDSRTFFSFNSNSSPSPVEIITGDYNNDGKLDLVTLSQSSSTISVFLKN